MHKLTIVLFALAALSLSEARILNRCQLVQELRWQGFPASQLRDWVCLIEAASGSNTAFVSAISSTGSRAWGLYGIWDTNWCSNTNVAGRGCNVRCSDLITPDISRASNCARIIFNSQGFGAWTPWTSRCRNQPLPDISHC